MTDTIEIIKVQNDKITFKDHNGERRTRTLRMIDGKPGFKFLKKAFTVDPETHAITIVSNGESITTPSITTDTPLAPMIEIKEKQSEFSITARFQFLEKFTNMVLDGITKSIIITGEGGLGKTYTVLEQLKNRNLVEDEDYVIVKGYSTPKALYATLYENRHGLIVFDDCDSVLKDPNSLNILKGALDSYDTRKVSWLSKGFIDDDLPSSFEFNGQIIFISNMTSVKLDGAVKSRSMVIDVSMTLEDKIDRMRDILPNVLPEFGMGLKEEVLDYLADHAAEAKEFNMRTLIKCIKVRVAYGEADTWKDAVKYLLTSV